MALTWLTPFAPGRFIAVFSHVSLLGLFVVVALSLPSTLRAWGGLSLLGLTVLGMAANAIKFYLTGMPITFLDLRLAVGDPIGDWHAIEPDRRLVLAALLIAAVYAVWSGRTWHRWLRGSSRLPREVTWRSRAVTLGCWMLIATSWWQVTARLPIAAKIHAEAYFRAELGEGLYDYSKALTIWGFLLYSHDLEVERNGNLNVASAATPVPAAALAQAAALVLNPLWRPPALLPHVVIVQAESSFNPSSIFRLSRAVTNPLFAPHPLARAGGPLLVNTVGGGSWISEFEVVTGLDSRIFGYSGFYTHVGVSPYIHGSLLTYLAARGYESTIHYSANAEFYGVGVAFARYGADHFIANPTGRSWEPNDEALMRQALSGLRAATGPQVIFLATAGNHSPHRCERFADATQFATTFAGSPGFTDENCILNEYVANLASTGRAITTALDTLAAEEARTGRPFVLLVYGDHQPHTFATNERMFEHRDHLRFAPFKYRTAERETFFRIWSSLDGRLQTAPPPMPHLTVLPTLLSAYVAARTEDLYLGVNLFAWQQCGGDALAPGRPPEPPACPEYWQILASYRASGLVTVAHPVGTK